MTRTGIVDLGFQGVPVADFAPLTELVPTPWKLAATGRNKQHTASQHQVPPIADFADFDVATPIVRAALAAALEMQALVLTHPVFLSRVREEP